ncbi:hypothetical protein BB560_002717 [Smittium megazygosporum]|uniref:RNB domain-containing protein n=1 Tax=Smittium megazygosporum TaxID=133381 RepID=A0A2T9ZE49_9FUNG|nr:hypothetical protein BB560_002717 [Smittium megazygosporum]
MPFLSFQIKKIPRRSLNPIPVLSTFPRLYGNLPPNASSSSLVISSDKGTLKRSFYKSSLESSLPKTIFLFQKRTISTSLSLENQNASRPSINPESLEAFKNLITKLKDASIKQQEMSASYASQRHPQLQNMDSHNPTLDYKFNQEGNKLILKRRPWKYRFPRARKYYKPGDLTGVSWNEFESEFFVSESLENKSTKTSTESSLKEQNNKKQGSNASNAVSPSDYVNLKKNLSQPTELFDSIALEFSKPASSHRLLDSRLWSDEDLEFAKEIERLVSSSEDTSSATDHNTADNMYSGIKNDTPPKNAADDSQSNTRAETENLQSPRNLNNFDQTSKTSSLYSSSDKATGNGDPSKIYNRKSRKYSTLVYSDPLFYSANRYYSTTKPLEHKTSHKAISSGQYEYPQIIKKGSGKAHSKLKSNTKETKVGKKTPPRRSFTDIDTKTGKFNKIEVISENLVSHKFYTGDIILCDEDFTYYQNLRLTGEFKIGDLVEGDNSARPTITFTDSRYSSFSIITSNLFGRFGLEIVGDENKTSSVSKTKFNVQIPNFFLRRSILEPLIESNSYEKLIECIFSNDETTKFNYKNQELTATSLLYNLITEYTSHVLVLLKSSIEFILTSGLLDPERLWNDQIKAKNIFISVEDLAIKLIFLNKNTRDFFLSEYTDSQARKRIFAKYKLDPKTLSVLSSSNIISKFKWDLAILTANELLSSNPKYFEPFGFGRPKDVTFCALDFDRVRKINRVKDNMSQNSEKLKSFHRKSILNIKKYLEKNPYILYFATSPVDEILFRNRVNELYDTYMSEGISTEDTTYNQLELDTIFLLKNYYVNKFSGLKNSLNPYSDIAVEVLYPMKLFDYIQPETVFFFLVCIGMVSEFSSIYPSVKKLNIPHTGTNYLLDHLYENCLSIIRDSGGSISHEIQFKNSKESKLPSNVKTELLDHKNVKVKDQDSSTTPSRSVYENNLAPNAFYSKDLCESIRHDFGSLKVYTIDDNSTLDVDDGVSIEKVESSPGVFETWIHIHVSDPTVLLHPNHIIADLAKARVSSTYLPEGTYHMLPSEWAINKFSLWVKEYSESNKKSYRYAMTTSIQIGEDGEISDYKVRPSIIRNVQKLPYDDLDEIYPDDYLSEEREKFKSVGVEIKSPSKTNSEPEKALKDEKISKSSGTAQSLSLSEKNDLMEIYRLSMLHSKNRIKNNCLIYVNYRSKSSLEQNDFFRNGIFQNYEKLPEKIIYSNSLTFPEISAGTEDFLFSPARNVVAELMIMAGKAVAKFAADNNLPIINRVQHRPNFDIYSENLFSQKSAIPEYEHLSVEELNSKIKPKDIWDTAMKYINPSTGFIPYKIYDDIRYFNNPVEFSTKSGPHSTMGIDEKFGYTRFTSPLRRYVDLVNHWQVKYQLLLNNGLAVEKDIPFTREQLEDMFEYLRQSEIQSRESMARAPEFWATKILQRIEYVARRTSDPSNPLLIQNIDLQDKATVTSNAGLANSLDKNLYAAGSELIKDMKFIPFDKLEEALNPNSSPDSETRKNVFITSNFLPDDPLTKIFEYSHLNGVVPVWRAIIVNRGSDILHSVGKIKSLGVQVKILPVPIDIEKRYFASDELDVVISHIDPVTQTITARVVFSEI